MSVADTAFTIAVVRAEEARRPEAERLFDDPHAAIFGSCEELAGDELWRRYLPGDPHPNARAMKIGVASTR
jgi:O-methyltransferase involved in polyketide biosynthesis